MRTILVGLLVLGGVFAAARVFPCGPTTCSNNCGTASTDSITTDYPSDCGGCRTACTTGPQCVQGCGSGPYQYVSRRVKTTTYHWTKCEGTGQTNCTDYHYDQGQTKLVEEWTFQCDGTLCCTGGLYCMPWVHETNYSSTPTYDYVKCHCPNS